LMIYNREVGLSRVNECFLAQDPGTLFIFKI
jgi:hypothetical protein